MSRYFEGSIQKADELFLPIVAGHANMAKALVAFIV